MDSALLEMPGPMRIEPQLLASMQSVEFFCEDQLTFLVIEASREQSVLLPPVLPKQETDSPNESSVIVSEPKEPDVAVGEKSSRNIVGMFTSPRVSALGSMLSSSVLAKRTIQLPKRG